MQAALIRDTSSQGFAPGERGGPGPHPVDTRTACLQQSFERHPNMALSSHNTGGHCQLRFPEGKAGMLGARTVAPGDAQAGGFHRIQEWGPGCPTPGLSLTTEHPHQALGGGVCCSQRGCSLKPPAGKQFLLVLLAGLSLSPSLPPCVAAPPRLPARGELSNCVCWAPSSLFGPNLPPWLRSLVPWLTHRPPGTLTASGLVFTQIVNNFKHSTEGSASPASTAMVWIHCDAGDLPHGSGSPTRRQGPLHCQRSGLQKGLCVEWTCE